MRYKCNCLPVTEIKITLPFVTVSRQSDSKKWQSEACAQGEWFKWEYGIFVAVVHETWWILRKQHNLWAWKQGKLHSTWKNNKKKVLITESNGVTMYIRVRKRSTCPPREKRKHGKERMSCEIQGRVARTAPRMQHLYKQPSFYNFSSARQAAIFFLFFFWCVRKPLQTTKCFSIFVPRHMLHDLSAEVNTGKTQHNEVYKGLVRS